MLSSISRDKKPKKKSLNIGCKLFYNTGRLICLHANYDFLSSNRVFKTLMRFSKSGRKHVLVYLTALASLLHSGFARFQRSRKKEPLIVIARLLEQICLRVTQLGHCQMSLFLLFVKYIKTGFSEQMFSDVQSTLRTLFRNVMLNWRLANLLCRTLYCTREN